MASGDDISCSETDELSRLRLPTGSTWNSFVQGFPLTRAIASPHDGVWMTSCSNLAMKGWDFRRAWKPFRFSFLIWDPSTPQWPETFKVILATRWGQSLVPGAQKWKCQQKFQRLLWSHQDHAPSSLAHLLNQSCLVSGQPFAGLKWKWPRQCYKNLCHAFAKCCQVLWPNSALDDHRSRAFMLPKELQAGPKAGASRVQLLQTYSNHRFLRILCMLPLWKVEVLPKMMASRKRRRHLIKNCRKVRASWRKIRRGQGHSLMKSFNKQSLRFYWMLNQLYQGEPAYHCICCSWWCRGFRPQQTSAIFAWGLKLCGTWVKGSGCSKRLGRLQMLWFFLRGQKRGHVGNAAGAPLAAWGNSHGISWDELDVAFAQNSGFEPNAFESDALGLGVEVAFAKEGEAAVCPLAPISAWERFEFVGWMLMIDVLNPTNIYKKWDYPDAT